MHTLKTLLRDIRAIGIRSNDSLLIHSSMKSMGQVDGGADTVIDAFQESLSEGLLIFPTHTWNEWNNVDGFYDPVTEPSCVGVLTEVFRKRENVFRSLHPTHSIAAWGKGAETYVQGEEQFETPGPRKGCWGRLYDVEAKILFLGASLKTNTFLHSVEEWYDIPDRIAPEPTGYRIKRNDGSIIERNFFHHFSKYGDPSQNFDKIEKLAVEKGVANYGEIGSASSVLCDARGLADLVGQLLQRDRHLFDDDAPMNGEL
ncbi:MAG: AAC(3) family N-acetyltransferase [Opitutales bacterium]|nr:AAC(3) family N-acetyltransferase [Opitutales bacterium]